jgi:hypothetical protein
MLRTGRAEQPLPQGKKFPYTNEQTRVTIFYLSRRPRRDHEEHEQFSKSDSRGAGSRERGAGSREQGAGSREQEENQIPKFLNHLIPQSLNPSIPKSLNSSIPQFIQLYHAVIRATKRQPEAAIETAIEAAMGSEQ